MRAVTHRKNKWWQVLLYATCLPPASVRNCDHISSVLSVRRWESPPPYIGDLQLKRSQLSAYTRWRSGATESYLTLCLYARTQQPKPSCFSMYLVKNTQVQKLRDSTRCVLIRRGKALQQAFGRPYRCADPPETRRANRPTWEELDEHR